MKKKLLSLLLMLLMVFPAALAESPAEPTYYYPTQHFGVYLFIAPSWEHLVIEDTVIFPREEYKTDENDSIVSGICLFCYKEDAYSVEDTAITQIAPDLTSPHLAGVVMYPAGGQPEDAGLVGYSYREVYAGEEYCVAAAWRDLAEFDPPEDAPLEALEALIASFRDTDEYIFVEEPLDSLGDFHTTDIYGEEITSHSVFSGEYKLTLVNVWATYCQPCLAEMPYLGELAKEYADKGVQIIGVPSDIFDSAGNVDADQLELARRYAESTGAEYPHIIPDSVMLSGLMREVYYVPNSWFFDSEGKMIGEAIVGSYSKEDWAAMIEERLARIEE